MNAKAGAQIFSFITRAHCRDTEEKIWFSQTNTTLIKALNEIVKRVGAKHWVIRKTKEKARIITLAF
jgi:hypothetical protein